MHRVRMADECDQFANAPTTHEFRGIYRDGTWTKLYRFDTDSHVHFVPVTALTGKMLEQVMRWHLRREEDAEFVALMGITGAPSFWTYRRFSIDELNILSDRALMESRAPEA